MGRVGLTLYVLIVEALDDNGVVAWLSGHSEPSTSPGRCIALISRF